MTSHEASVHFVGSCINAEGWKLAFKTGVSMVVDGWLYVTLFDAYTPSALPSEPEESYDHDKLWCCKRARIKRHT